MRVILPFIVALVTLTVNLSSMAEVLDSTAAGFTVGSTVTIRKRSKKVYTNLVDRIGEWWSSAHTFSGNAKNLSLKDQVGGCFCERLSGGGQVKHLEVVYVEPRALLRMKGGLGPLQELALTGVLTFRLTPSGKATQVEMKYSVAGYAPDGIEALAPAVDRVLGEQLSRLKNYSETGRP